MPKSNVHVGKSWRTPIKHTLLNRIVGREAGMLARCKPRFLALPYVMIDLCAGDGVDTLESGTCSPGILYKHSKFLGDNCHRVLVEKDPNTFAQLQTSPYAVGAAVVNRDAQLIRFPADYDKLSTPAFIHHDPNTVHSWSLTTELILSCPKRTTTLSTLGCNAGGIKQLPKHLRDEWFEKLDTLLGFLPLHHDACVVALQKDHDQWAYLLTGPKRWKDKYTEDIRGAFRQSPKGYEHAWHSDGSDFDSIIQKLFLTGKERA